MTKCDAHHQRSDRMGIASGYLAEHRAQTSNQGVGLTITSHNIYGAKKISPGTPLYPS